VRGDVGGAASLLSGLSGHEVIDLLLRLDVEERRNASGDYPGSCFCEGF